jgi:hypothetical protein
MFVDGVVFISTPGKDNDWREKGVPVTALKKQYGTTAPELAK